MIETITVELPASGWRARSYQRPAWEYLKAGGRNAVCVWHRRAGKDEIALHHAAKAAHKRKGNYWHMLPEYAQARKAIWDAINPHSGKRRIDEAFPHELRKRTNDQEMKIEFHCGSIWQVVGSDNFNSLVGSPPVGIVYSEWALADPRAHAFLRPILAENGGWQLFIYTSRGYNHGFSTHQAAKEDPQSFCQLLTVDDTKAIAADVIERERVAYLAEYGEDNGDALFRQEYYCDFSAANVGSILGRYVEKAEKEGRILDLPIDPDGAPLEISSDLGYRDTATWWFWQPMYDGFAMVDYDEGTGLDAPGWIERLKAKGHNIGKIWLPHDARARSFATRHSPHEQFAEGFGWDKVEVIPNTSIADRINAARVVMPSCRFDAKRCKPGIQALREWQFEYDLEARQFSKTPLHNWASHPADGFSYGAQVMRDRVKAPPKPTGQMLEDHHWPTNRPTFNDLVRRATERRMETEG